MTPTVVATPLPPLNRSHGLQQWPITGAMTISQCGPNSHTASEPFAISPISVIAARHLLETRRTLLKPGFFEPTFVISMPVPSIAIFAKGMEPIRNATSTFSASVILLIAARYRACVRSLSRNFIAEVPKQSFPSCFIGILFGAFRRRTIDHSHDSPALFALRNDDFERIGGRAV